MKQTQSVVTKEEKKLVSVGFYAVHRVTSNAVVPSVARAKTQNKSYFELLPQKVERLAGLEKKEKRKTKIIACRSRPNTSHSHVLNQYFPLRNVLVALPRPPLPAFARRVGPVGRHSRLIFLLLLSILPTKTLPLCSSSNFFFLLFLSLFCGPRLSLSLFELLLLSNPRRRKKNFTLSLPRFLRTRAKAIDFRSFLSIFSARNGSSETCTGESTGIRPG